MRLLEVPSARRVESFELTTRDGRTYRYPHPSWFDRPPRRVLLATDLSARSDRAADRARILAEQWKAQLFILHVMERQAPRTSNFTDPPPSWKHPPDAVTAAKERVLVELGDVAKNATIVVDDGDPSGSIARTADEEDCELIVMGIARNELFGHLELGRTVDRLLRQTRIPILVVKQRARRPYHRIVVATDLSERSRNALQTAARFFPQQALTVLHAYDPPTALIAESGAYRREYRKVALQDCEAFLREAGLQNAGNRISLLVEFGHPHFLLCDYVVDESADLVVLGTHGRCAVLSILIGSVAKRVLADVPCDVLLTQKPSSG